MTARRAAPAPAKRSPGAPPYRQRKVILERQKHLCSLCQGWLFPGLYTFVPSHGSKGRGTSYVAACVGCYVGEVDDRVFDDW